MSNAKEDLLERQRAHVKSLFKMLLIEMQSLKEDHDERYRLLQDQLEPQHLPMLLAANPLTDDRFMRIRKKILDVSNDILRAMDADSDRYVVNFVARK